MLAFFPWLTLDEPLKMGRVHFVRFQRGEAPAGCDSPEQRTIDAVLEPFLDVTRPVNVGTVAHFDGQPFTAPLDEGQRNELFVLAQILTFGGLAAREYCQGGMAYCNTADFAFLVQGFSDEPNGTLFERRRRDGFTTVRVTAGAYQVRAPPHRTNDRPVRIDRGLLEGLQAARGHRIWDRLFEAMTAFLRANSDSAEIAEQAEIVDITGAFEKALGVWGSDPLKREFEKHFKPTADIAPRDAPRVPPALRNGTSVRRLWIGDLYDLRNAHAHGSQAIPSNLLWDRAEHLLLGAYAFPLLVKSLLNEEGLYQLTSEDAEAIDLFEWRARADGHLLGSIKDDDGEHEAVRWNRLHVDFLRDRGRRRLEAAMRKREADSKPAPPDDQNM